MSNICEICNSDLRNLHNLEHHRQYCGTHHGYKAVKSYLKEKCPKCDLEFNPFLELSVHLFTCGIPFLDLQSLQFNPFLELCVHLFTCGIPFLDLQSLQWHIKSLHHGYSSTGNTGTSTKPLKSCKCAICRHICGSRRDLYNHRMNQHGGNGGNADLEELPHYVLEEQNPELRNTYVTNKNHIHAEHSHGDIKHVYNFPSNNLNGGFLEIRGHLMEIYNDQQNAFRINLAFGMILFNAQTQEYRYYIPYYNRRILQYPFTISNRNSINFLMNKFTKIDIIEQAKSVRSSTA